MGLEGQLPLDLFEHLPNLRFVDFGGNMFTGEIPEDWRSNSRLANLHLEENRLEGEHSIR